MSVTPYEELLERMRSGGRVGGRTDPSTVDSTVYVGGASPGRINSGPVNRPATRPSQRSVSRPINFSANRNPASRSGGGGLDALIGGVKRWGSGVVDNVMGGGLQKNGGDAFAEINAQKAMEDLLAGMPGAFTGDPLSFLSRAREAIGDGGMSAALDTIRNREEDYKRQAQQGDSRLAAMYDQLRNSILEDSETVSGITNEAREGMSEISDREQQGITAAHQATQNRQNEILSRLGIEDAAAIGLAQGDVQGRTNQQALENAASRDAAAQQYTTSVGQNAQNLNTNNAAAAGLEGTSRRADLENQLQSMLARLRDEAAATQQEYGNRNMQLAMSLAGQMYDAARSNHQSQLSNWMDRFNIKQGMEDRAWDRDMQMRGMDLDAQQMAAEMAAEQAKANQVPWNQMSPLEQFNTSTSRMLGGPQQAATAQSVLSRHISYEGGRTRIDYSKAVDDLIAQGYPEPVAQGLVAQYANSLGIR